MDPEENNTRVDTDGILQTCSSKAQGARIQTRNTDVDVDVDAVTVVTGCKPVCKYETPSTAASQAWSGSIAVRDLNPSHCSKLS